jgi:predicted nucleic acid-binding Zn ribbon protein
LATRRHKKPWKQPKEVSVRIDAVLDKLDPGARARLVELRVCLAWEEAVGDSIARRSSATRLERGVLHVTVESPTWMNELKFIEKDIVSRVNARFQQLLPQAAPNPVDRIATHLGTVPARKPKAAPVPDRVPDVAELEGIDARVRSIEDPELRAAARALLLKGAKRGS